MIVAKVGSLFSGGGGIELGLAWAGIGPVVWQVEIDPFCRGVLAKHFPRAKRYDDVRRVGARNLEPVDVMCGGFPCQDISVAGFGAGLDGERSGLWREYARIVDEMRPRVVLIENVAALATRGLDVVAGQLRAFGYCVHARIVAASDVGAPHLRERLYIVGHTVRARSEGRDDDTRSRSECAREEVADAGDDRCEGGRARHDDHGRDASRNDTDGRDPLVADADGGGLREQQQWKSGRRSRTVRARRQTVSVDVGARGRRRPQSRLGGDAHGLPDRVDRWPARPGDAPAFWEPPREMSKYSPTRCARLEMLGNAQVPQVITDEIAPFVAQCLR